MICSIFCLTKRCINIGLKIQLCHCTIKYLCTIKKTNDDLISVSMSLSKIRKKRCPEHVHSRRTLSGPHYHQPEILQIRPDLKETLSPNHEVTTNTLFIPMTQQSHE